MGKILQSVFSLRMLFVFLMGFASGLPLILTGGTLKAWMKEAGVDLTIIGAFSLVGLPYALKFLWAPFLDRYVPRFLGRRRGWIIITQFALAFALVGLGVSNPTAIPTATAIAAFLVCFASATQDIGIDAYRREILRDEELGFGSSLAVNGYRVGMLVAGAGALALADHVSWSMTYAVMGAIALLSAVVTLLSPEPRVDAPPPRTLKDAAIKPIQEFFSRRGAVEILLFIVLYKIGESMASDLLNPFYLDLGFTKSQIAGVAKLFGFWATILGGLLGGILMIRIGIFHGLWVFGILQSVAILGFSVLANAGTNIAILATTISLECLTSGMATAAYVGFMGSLCNKRFTATQYALLSSLMGVPRIFFGATSGYFAKHLGWTNYFIFCTLLTLPGLLFLLRVKHWQTQASEN